MADIKQTLERIQGELRRGRFINEAAVSQGIVLPLLNALGWPVFETRIVPPQFGVAEGRVDYALCHPEDQPKIFVEVKRVGQCDGGDRQLFEYVFHKGIPLAILTDGQEWHFYLPLEQGEYEDRRYYKLDILERSLDESSERFERYLKYNSVCSGQAIETARADYKDVNRERQVQQILPQAWKRLVEEPDELLVDLLVAKVEDLCGYKPDLETCTSFLRGRLYAVSQTAPPTPRDSHPRPRTNGRIGFKFGSQFIACGSAREVMTNLLQQFDQRDPSFLDRFAARKHGRKRRYVANTKLELYPGRPDLSEHSFELRSGWFVGTNYNKKVIQDIIKLACEVAEVAFGTVVVVELGE